MGEGMLTIGNSFTLRADFWDNIEKDYMKGDKRKYYQTFFIFVRNSRVNQRHLISSLDVHLVILRIDVNIKTDI